MRIQRRKKFGFKIGLVIGFLFTIAFIMAFFSIYFHFEEKSNYKIGESYASGENLSIIKISYINLTEGEKKYFEDIFLQINPLYLFNQKEIIVAKNLTEHCEEVPEGRVCNGVNYGRGDKIYIRFRTDEEALKTTICHENLHTYFLGDTTSRDTPLHKIIYELGRQQVCFKK